MVHNRDTFERLIRSAHLRVCRAPLFDTAPPAMPARVDPSRVEGMLLGLAIGDALGNTSESMLPSDRRATFGEIRHYVRNRHAEDRCVGLPSDDTQLAFWTLEQILEDGGLDPARLADRFASRRIFGIGSAVRQFLRNYKSGKPWYQAGAHSAGNGALMRIAPVLIPHLDSATAELWVDTALAASLTHNDATSTGACVAFIGILWQLLAATRSPAPTWWVEQYVSHAAGVEGEAQCSTRSRSLPGYAGPLWRFVEERVPAAWAERKSVLEAGHAWHSGAYLLETVPTVLHILMLHADDPEEAIVRAVNDTWDNDTVAALVGAAVGALHGRDALPERWVEGLLGRTGADDDGRVFGLIAAACQFRSESLSRDGEAESTVAPPSAIQPRDARLEDRLRGMLVGLAVGDALGAAVEFRAPGTFEPVVGYRGGGPHGLGPGEWTDDTSMALALADSIAEAAWDLRDQAQRYVDWYSSGRYSVNGRCFDIGNQTARSLAKFGESGDPWTCSPAEESASGNGSIMRLAPVPIAFASCYPDAVELLADRAAESSVPTHRSRICRSACRYMALVLAALANGVPRDEILDPRWLVLERLEPLHPSVSAVACGSLREKAPRDIQGSGFVVKSLEAALWAFHDAADFREAVLRAVNLGDDADTTGAVCGQLAGAYWGESGIPVEWREGLARMDMIEQALAGLLPMALGGGT